MNHFRGTQLVGQDVNKNQGRLQEMQVYDLFPFGFMKCENRIYTGLY